MNFPENQENAVSLLDIFSSKSALAQQEVATKARVALETQTSSILSQEHLEYYLWKIANLLPRHEISTSMQEAALGYLAQHLHKREELGIYGDMSRAEHLAQKGTIDELDQAIRTICINTAGEFVHTEDCQRVMRMEEGFAV